MKIPYKYRRITYAVAMVVLVGSLAIGIVTPDQLSEAANSAVKIVGAISAFLALINATPDSQPLNDNEFVEAQ